MSDDLVSILRESDYFAPDYEMAGKAADRIEELEAENRLLKNSGIIEVAVRNPSVMEYMQHWEGRAEAAEAKLTLAKEMYETSMLTAGGSPEAWRAYVKARNAFAEAIKETPHD